MIVGDFNIHVDVLSNSDSTKFRDLEELLFKKPLTKLIEDNRCDQRKLFRANKSLFNQSQGDELPPNLHAPTFASDIGKYFVSKIDTIQRQIDADIIDLPASAFTTADGFNRSTPSLSAFKILFANSVKSLIHNSTLKSCSLDPMPSRLVSRCDALLSVITTIIENH